MDYIDPIFAKQNEDYEKNGVKLGCYSSYVYKDDPRRLGFVLARYKFVSKMLYGKQKVLEVGCGDGIGIPVVSQTVSFVHGIDREPFLLEDNRKRLAYLNCSFAVADILEEPLSLKGEKFDAAYSLDVVEHIPSERDFLYYEHVVASIKNDGIFIVGTPNVTASQYASKLSKEGHINLKSHDKLREDLSKYFENVFMFGMNDEVIHTGFSPMAHYLFAIGVGLRQAR